ncbi:MAG: hypothetical protein HZB99_04190 [Candidatus Harrisonbacteria bacterium]|nr:hypothetical protein [Candidatus Harrisonbacteria bacterium]
MIIFLYGPDSYRRQQKLKEIVLEYKEKHSGFSIEHFNLEDDGGLDKLKDFVKARSLFDNFKLGIVKGGSNLEKTAQKEYIELLKENLKVKEQVLVISQDKKPTKEFKFLLEKPALHQEFENLFGAELGEFFDREAKSRDLNFNSAAKDLLLGAFMNDGWGLVTELDKLSLLDEKKISLKILEDHLDASLPVNIFFIINQIRNSSRKSERLSLLEELLSRSEDAAVIFNIMAVSPYADKGWKEKVADYDAAVKSGKLEYDEALLDLVMSN